MRYLLVFVITVFANIYRFFLLFFWKIFPGKLFAGITNAGNKTVYRIAGAFLTYARIEDSMLDYV